MKHYFLISILLIISSLTTAQNKPEYKKKAFKDSTGTVYWNKALPLYISLSTEPNGEHINLESRSQPQCDNPFYLDTEGINFIRTRWAVDKETKQYIRPQQELMWEVYADSKAPVSHAKFTSSKMIIKDGKHIYGGKTRILLSSKDVTSGIQEINFSINGKAYQKYTNPIELTQAGDYTIKYFAVDLVGNVEEDKTLNFTIDNQPPSTICIITGVKIGDENIISKHSKLHLERKDNYTGTGKSYYQIDGGKTMIYNGISIPIAQLNDGKHVLTFYSEDKVGNKEAEQTLNFYLDKTAPITASDVLGDRFIINGQTYFSGKTKLKLTAVDNKSGVKNIFYSVNGGKWQKYTDAFYLPKKAGIHIVKYFATDNTENITTDAGNLNSKYLQYRHKIDRIYIDLLGPKISYSITGPKFRDRDTLFISPKTKISFKAYDNESGLHHISYSIKNERKEILYEAPFSLDETSGHHRVEYFAYDNVNNRNIGAFDIIFDKTGPEIESKFSIKSAGMQDGLEIYPAYSKLFLSAQDDLTGIKQIYYSLNGKPETVYRNYINGFKKNAVNIVKIRATDMLDNSSTKEIKFFAN